LELWKPAGTKKLYRHYPQTGESHTATQLASSLDASTKSPDVAKFLNPRSFQAREFRVPLSLRHISLLLATVVASCVFLVSHF